MSRLPDELSMDALYRTDTIRRIEQAWIAELGGGVLMGRAASAVADAAAEVARRNSRGAPIVALVGPGNNGGDALLALMRLAQRGFEVAGLALSPDVPSADDARQVWHAWHAQGRTLEPLDALPVWISRGAIFIDGLFGIGLGRPMTGSAARAAALLRPETHRVVAVDVPSGLDADTGAIVGGPGGAAIRAAITVTMIGDKPGLHTGEATDHVGAVRVAALGLDTPPEGGLRLPDGASVAPDGERFSLRSAAALLTPRPRNSHKGSFGAVTVIGGSVGTVGAALLAARGAQAMGAGRVWIASPDAPVFDPGQPQLMTRPIDAPLETMDALCVGCGLGRGDAAQRALAAALAAPCTLVLDADALNLLSRHAALAHALVGDGRRQSVLTPHPLEAARLLEIPTEQVQADRVGSAVDLAARFGASVVLKGAGSVVAAPDGRWWIVDSGSPALATAGTGDVLAGIVSALLAQGHPGDRAARLGAWLHGAAGDLWHREHPLGTGLSAARLPELLIECLRTFEPA